MKLLKKFNFFKNINMSVIIRFLPIIVSTVLFFVIFLVSVTNNFQLTEQMRDTYYQSAFNRLDKLRTENEVQKSSIKNLCLQISFNDEIHKLFLHHPNSLTVNYVSNHLKSYASFVDGINSINIYDGRKKILYSPSGEFETDSYSGISFEEYNGKIPYALKEFHIETTGEEGSKLIYSYTLEDTNNIIIIDIDTEKFYNNFTNYHIENNSHILVTNKHNKTVYSSDPSLSFEIIPHTNDYKLIRFEGAEYMCFYVSSAVTEYTYTTFIPYNIVTQSALIQKNYYFIIIMIIILLIIIISYILTLKIKEPLTQLLNKSEMYDHHKYNDELKKNQIILKTYLTTEFPSNDDTNAVYNILKEAINESANSLILLSFSYDESANKNVSFSKKEFDALLFGISNICTEIVSQYSKIQVTFDTEKSIVLICTNIHFASGKLEEAAKECIELVKTHLGISISAQISTESDFEQLYDAYSEIIKIRKYKYIHGPGKVMDYRITLKKDTNDDAKRTQKKILACFNDNNYKGAEEEFDKYVDILKKMPVEESHIFVTEFIILLINYLKNIETPENNAENFDQITFFTNVNTAECIDDIKIYIEEVFSYIYLLNEKKENSYYEKIVQQVNNLVLQNCCDMNFCSNTIAESLNLSTAYLNRIYRQKSGDTLTKFILKTRLENAKKLILETSLTIKEIAFNTGFMSDSYFILLFKKEFNCTPSSYRSTYKK